MGLLLLLLAVVPLIATGHTTAGIVLGVFVIVVIILGAIPDPKGRKYRR